MKIENSFISMSGKSTFTQTSSEKQSLKVWTDSTEVSDENTNLNKDSVVISESGNKLSMQKNGQVSNNDDFVFELSDEDTQKIQLIEKFIESLTGKKIKLIIPEKIKIKDNVSNNTALQISSNAHSSQNEKVGWGLEYDSIKTHYEKQSMSFESAGIIKTSDGKEIDFSLSLNLDREFINKESISIRAGDAIKKDPLVINFDRPSAALTDTKISFDIDCDGKSDQISNLVQGSGFLSLDLNNDGKINDGSELFGTKSQNGFSDLAKYDEDKNNWIDENDEIFDKLRIWTKDEAGNDILFALGEKGIGAIYLGNISTDFSLKNAQNTEQGQIRKTGIFVKENGTVGTIQHVDLVV